MRPRTEAILALSVLTVLAVAAALLGPARAAPDTTVNQGDPSTFLADPGGARALLEAAQRMGIDVLRFRERPTRLATLAHRPRQLFAEIGPDAPVSAPDLPLVMQLHQASDLLLAGATVGNVMRCLGYRVEQRVFDSARVTGLAAPAPFVHAWLVATHERVHVDSSRAMDVGLVSCAVPAILSVDTLLRSSHGPVVLRLMEASGRKAILFADASLLSNEAMRRTSSGPFALSLLEGRYQNVVFDEYHHGYGESGSLAQATLDWSLRSPWGWAVWQLAVVGVLALLSGAVRFGAAIPGIPRTRRSSLEHVRALATALATAQGHDQAIAAIVRGLRRRLTPPSLRIRGDWQSWLASRDRPGATAAEREVLTTLGTLTQPGQPSSSVLQAANAVEDLWQSLQH